MSHFVIAESLIGAAVVAAVRAFSAQAEEFSWQLSGAMRQIEANDFETDSWAVDGTYYMNPIADNAGPYALASFLNPTTRVSATASRSDSPQDVFDDPTAYTLGGAYVLPGEKWYVGAEYAKSDVDDAPPVTISDPKGYGVHAGRYLGANTTLELRLGRSEQKSSLTCPPGRVLHRLAGRDRTDHGLRGPRGVPRATFSVADILAARRRVRA